MRVLAEIVRAMRSSGSNDPAGTDHQPGADASDGVEPQDWGHLRILQRLGSGSYGVVYRAFETRLQCDVALKLAKPTRARELDESRALKEARMLARVRHANVVSVYGADAHDGRFGLWMELVDGRTLEQALVTDGPMGAHEAAHVGVELCKALAAVHQAGLLHRDIKASNVMREKGGRILLMDFGAGRPQPKPDHPSPGLAGTPLIWRPNCLRAARRRQLRHLQPRRPYYHLVTARYQSMRQALKPSNWRTGVDAVHCETRPDLPSSFVNVIERARRRLARYRPPFGMRYASQAPPSSLRKIPRPTFEWWKPPGLRPRRPPRRNMGPESAGLRGKTRRPGLHRSC